MADTYIARKRLKVGEDFVMPGEEIPQAVTWRNLHSYLASGAVVMVRTDVVESMPYKQIMPTEEDLDWQHKETARKQIRIIPVKRNPAEVDQAPPEE